MPDDEVTIDPEFRPPRRGQQPRDGTGLRRLGVAAVIAATFLLGWLLRSPEGSAPRHSGLEARNDATAEDRVIAGGPETGPPSPVVSGVPLSEAVPGFDDTITALTWDNDGVGVLRWRASQPAPETVMSLRHDDGGWNRSVDASGRWFVEIRDEAALTVHAVTDGGTPSRKLPFEADGGVSGRSPAWHDTRPGRLAWLACPAETPASWVLYTTDVARPAAEPNARLLSDLGCGDAGAWLARWGDWGMLLHTSDGSGTRQVLLNAEGAEIARGRLGPGGAWFVGPGPAGTTVWTEGLERADATSFLLSADGLERLAVPGLTPGERLESALISPDGSLIALIPDFKASRGSAVRIVEVDTGSVVAEVAEPSWWVTRMVWSTDGRFLIYERWPDVASNWAGVPSDVELVFYDTEISAAVALPLPAYAPALRAAA